MAITRTVFLPLNRDPEVLFGLRLADLIWVLAAVVFDLMVWRWFHRFVVGAIAGMVAASLLGLMLAVTRIQDASMPEWTWRAIQYGIAPRLYLP